MRHKIRIVIVSALVLTSVMGPVRLLRAQSQNSVGGGANGASSQVNATVLGVPASASQPSVAPVTLPPNGGSFRNQVNSSNNEIPGVLPGSSTGTVIDTTSGSVTQSSAHAESRSEVNNASMLGGLITASKIVSQSTSDGNGSTASSTAAGSYVEGLRINGQVSDQREFPPNTSIGFSGTVLTTVAGLPVSSPVSGTIILNEQVGDGNGTTTSSLTVNYIHVIATGGVPGQISFSENHVMASASSSVSFTASGGGGGGNNPPVLNLPGPQSVQVGNTLNFVVSASDPDAGDTVTLTASSLPANSSFTPNPANGNPAQGQFSFTPSSVQAGQSFTINFVARDSHGGTTSGSVSVAVTSAPPPGDNPPSLTLPGPQTVDTGKTLTFDVSASDPDAGDTVTLTASSIPSNAGVTPNPANGNPTFQHFTFTPSPSQAGQTYTIVFIAIDSHGASTSGAVQVTVRLGQNQNHPPFISVPGAQIIGVGQTLRFTVIGSDPDGDPVTLSASSIPANGSFNPSTGGFTFTPASNQNGQTYVVTFTATDSKGSSASATVPITVVTSSTAGPPIISVPPSPIIVPVGDPVDFVVGAVSPKPNCAVHVAVSGLPTHATFDSLANRFQFTPTSDQANTTFLERFTATDCDGQSSTASVTIIVVGPEAEGTPGHVCLPVNKLFFGGTGVGGSCGSVTVTLSNDGGGPLTISSASFADGTNYRLEGASTVPLVLQGGGTIPLKITFEPKHTGVLLDTLTIATSDPDQRTVSIDLKGKGLKQ